MLDKFGTTLENIDYIFNETFRYSNILLPKISGTFDEGSDTRQKIQFIKLKSAGIFQSNPLP